ncbi:Crp/Fnr family transcriptional regulator [Piscinibacter koreensis]|uniref:Crp/Fnr family transcriptional regulator n=1 Tax=Piscinibacter koreensis TaxID=2742824 RepID=A0A7Y6TZ88_9BURK|nr:Crp/Fnr family transcriptional regulator [Schlegelella koreensis]NUZ08882.1 Crp/Fnr family transcriptional regulator [Schlegelella koreensis]
MTIETLRRLPVFAALTPDEAQSICDRSLRRRYRRGEFLVEHGARSEALFVLLNGRARVLQVDRRGREVHLARLRAGDYVGEMSLIDEGSHSASVRAEAQTDVLVLGRAEFSRLMPEPSSLAYGLMRGLVQRLRSANQQIQSLALLDVQGRVAETLLSMSESVGTERVIREPVSRTRLAQTVGASREMISRVMKELEARGTVRIQANGWLVIQQ